MGTATIIAMAADGSVGSNICTIEVVDVVSADDLDGVLEYNNGTLVLKDADEITAGTEARAWGTANNVGQATQGPARNNNRYSVPLGFEAQLEAEFNADFTVQYRKVGQYQFTGGGGGNWNSYTGNRVISVNQTTGELTVSTQGGGVLDHEARVVIEVTITGDRLQTSPIVKYICLYFNRDN